MTEIADTVMSPFNGQEVSEEAYWEAVTEQDSKEDVEWVDLLTNTPSTYAEKTDMS